MQQPNHANFSYTAFVDRSKISSLVDEFRSQSRDWTGVDISTIRGPYYSIIDLPGIPANHFHPRLGSIRLPRDSSGVPELDEHYSRDRYDNTGHRTFARGYDYYASFDKTLVARALIARYSKTICDGFKLLDSISQAKLTENSYLYYLGILDQVKNCFLRLYHTCEYDFRLRDGTGIGLSPNNFKLLENFMIIYTRAFYLALLGHDIKSENIFSLAELSLIMILVDQIKQILFTKDRLYHPKLDNTYLIGSQALRYANIYPETKMVIALPSGGTQFGISLNLALELKGKKNYLHFLHYSQRSGVEKLGSPTSVDWVHQQLKVFEVENHHVLVADDSVRTGRSMDDLVKLLNEAQVASIHACFVEIDADGILTNNYKEPLPLSIPVANPLHPDIQRVKYVQRITGDGLNTPIRKRERSRAKEIVNIYKLPAIRESNWPYKLLKSAIDFASRVGALLIKPDAVELGIAEELIYEAQNRLMPLGVYLVGIEMVDIPVSAGRKLYQFMEQTKIDFLMQNYLTSGPSVIAVFNSDSSAHATTEILNIRGKGLVDYSLRDFEELSARGLTSSLRGIIPVAGTRDIYVPAIEKLIQKLKQHGPPLSTEHNLVLCRNLVHAPDNYLELFGLLSLLSDVNCQTFLGDRYSLYKSLYKPA